MYLQRGSKYLWIYDVDQSNNWAIRQLHALRELKKEGALPALLPEVWDNHPPTPPQFSLVPNTGESHGQGVICLQGLQEVPRF